MRIRSAPGGAAGAERNHENTFWMAAEGAGRPGGGGGPGSGCAGRGRRLEPRRAAPRPERRGNEGSAEGLRSRHHRSEERSVGKERGSNFKSRWEAYHSKKKNKDSPQN